MSASIGIRRELRATFDEALVRIPKALESEGFGVLTEIDLQATLKRKLGADVRRYRIFGACNPPFAREALELDVEIGLALPCNVVLYEDDRGQAVVVAVDPTRTVAAAGNARMGALAAAVKQKLERALERLE